MCVCVAGRGVLAGVPRGRYSVSAKVTEDLLRALGLGIPVKQMK